MIPDPLSAARGIMTGVSISVAIALFVIGFVLATVGEEQIAAYLMLGACGLTVITLIRGYQK